MNALLETCVYTLQTSEPRIHPEMPQKDEPERQQKPRKTVSEARTDKRKWEE